jgi:hypothetical protein
MGWDPWKDTKKGVKVVGDWIINPYYSQVKNSDTITDDGLGDPFGDYHKAAEAAGAAQAEAAASGQAIETVRTAEEEANRIRQPYSDLGRVAMGGLGPPPETKDFGGAQLQIDLTEGQRYLNKMLEVGAPAEEIAKQQSYVTSLQGRVSSTGLQQSQFDQRQQALGSFGGIPQLIREGDEARGFQRDQLGLNSPEAQQAQYNQVLNSPAYQEMVRQGESALLQNASATGGLRGGNTQAALAQFRPQMMNSLMDQRYSRLGGLSAVGTEGMTNLATLGQASAAGQAASGIQTGANVANLMGNQASAMSNAQMARQGAMGSGLDRYGQMVGTAANIYGSFA